MPIPPPFRLRRNPESIAIEAGDGRVIAYVYFEDEDSRRQLTRRLSSAEATDAAKIMAAALRAAFPEGT
jgi:hypothetical protein